MTHHDDRLATWLAAGPPHAPAAGLERALAATRTARQRPAWLATILNGGAIGADRAASTFQLISIVVAVAAVTVLIGGLVVSGWLRPPPTPPVVPPSSSESPEASSVPSASPPPQTGLVAYSVVTQLERGEGSCPEGRTSALCYPSRIWIANADGSDARELLPAAPGFTREAPIAWSPDGSRLLYQADTRGDVDGLVLADPIGSDRQPLDVCEEGVCSGIGEVTFSPDGSRLSFVWSDVQDGSVIAIMDLGSGSTIELDSTRTNAEPRGTCESHCDGATDGPRWSPDGTRLVFARQGTFNAETGEYETILLMVNADGSDLHQVVPAELSAITPSWSPDGAWIVFTSSNVTLVDPETIIESLDVYRARPDGTDIQRLTSDGLSGHPTWTRDGRIIFVRFLGVDSGAQTGFELWVMDADGANPTQLPADDLAALTAAGCVVCPYPPMNFDHELPALNDAVWQPSP